MPAHELTEDDVERFVREGFVRLPGAIPREVAIECREVLWPQVEAQVPGLRRDEPATWTRPVVRAVALPLPPFRTAASSPALTAVCDRLVGPGRWARDAGGGLAGTVPVRFPHPDDPGDAGWHLDAGYAGPDGTLFLNHRSRGRALLLLVLLSDVGPDDAPTRLRPGSHRLVEPHLAAFGDAGVSFLHAVPPELATDPDPAEVVLATGEAGDVYACHPFLVHAADRHRGTEPRFVVQAGIVPTDTWDLARPTAEQSPVERAVSGAADR